MNIWFKLGLCVALLLGAHGLSHAARTGLIVSPAGCSGGCTVTGDITMSGANVDLDGNKLWMDQSEATSNSVYLSESTVGRAAFKAADDDSSLLEVLQTQMIGRVQFQVVDSVGVAFGNSDDFEVLYDSGGDRLDFNHTTDGNVFRIGRTTLSFSPGGTAEILIGANGLIANLADGGGVINETASATNPTLVPDRTNLTSGIGCAGDDVCLINSGAAALTTSGGETDVAGVSGDGAGSVVCVKSDGDLGTCSDAPDVNGDCTCG